MAKRRYRDLDEDDLEEDRPRPRRRGGGDSRAPIIIAVVCLLVALLGGGGALGYWLLAVRPKQQLQKKGEQLLGKWSSVTSENPRIVMTFHFRADGTFTISGSVGVGGVGVSQEGIWKVVGGKGHKIRVHTETGGRVNRDMDFDFVSADCFQRQLDDGRTLTFNRLH